MNLNLTVDLPQIQGIPWRVGRGKVAKGSLPSTDVETFCEAVMALKKQTQVNGAHHRWLNLMPSSRVNFEIALRSRSMSPDQNEDGRVNIWVSERQIDEPPQAVSLE